MKKTVFILLLSPFLEGCSESALESTFNPNSCKNDTTMLHLSVVNNETGAPVPNATIGVSSIKIICSWGCSFQIEGGQTNSNGKFDLSFEHDTSKNIYYTTEIRPKNDSFGPNNVVIHLNKGCVNTISLPIYRYNTIETVVTNNTTDSVWLNSVQSIVTDLYNFTRFNKQELSSILVNETIPPSGVKKYRLNGISNQKLVVTARLGGNYGNINREFTASGDSVITVNLLVK